MVAALYDNGQICSMLEEEFWRKPSSLSSSNMYQDRWVLFRYVTIMAYRAFCPYVYESLSALDDPEALKLLLTA